MPKNRLFISAVILFILFFLQGCHFKTNVYGMYKNENIDGTKRNQIKLLNEKLVSGIHSANITSIKEIFSEGLVQHLTSNFDSVLLVVKSFTTNSDFQLIGEYDILSSNNNSENNSIPVNEFNLSFSSSNQETYVSLLDISNDVYDILITAIYGNYDGKWRLNILQFGKYKLYGKTAKYYYKIAKENYDKSNLIDAYFNIDIAGNLYRPVNDYSQHQNKSDIDNLNKRIIDGIDLNYKFPITYNSIKTEPSIFKINNNIWDGGHFPLFQYLTKIDIKDTLALKIENQQLEKEIEKSFSGLRNNNKYIYTQAYNVMPDGIHKTYYYVFRNSTN
jgi:hypothetical protein